MSHYLIQLCGNTPLRAQMSKTEGPPQGVMCNSF